jgi:cellulose synthase/poly-beta-1,6-N-acetylglucosamine synthase-like glycosyltransferase
VRILFWTAGILLAYAQLGYGLLLEALRRSGLPLWRAPGPGGARPRVSVIVAAFREEAVIAARVANLLALDWPRDALEVIVAVDGGADPGADRTAERARAAGADRVLELPRGGKVRAQDAAVRAASGELLAFSDANATWAPDALAALAAAFADPSVGYACGRVEWVNEAGTNQEGLYWRWDMFQRARESALASVTAGNGAIYAVRPEAYVEMDAVMGHDLSLPFTLVKAGWRAVEVEAARATEKMVPTVEGEWRRKRRMMSHAWAIVLRGGMLDPRGYPPLYALFIASHRVLRYVTPFLHVYCAAALAQAAVLAAAAAGGRVRSRPLLVARYYVLTTASLAFGLYDHLRHGTEAGWDAAEGTR